MMAALLVAAAIAVAVLGGPEVAGLARPEAVAVLVYAAALAWLTGWAVERGRPGWPAAFGAVAMWSVFVTATTLVYLHRDAAIEHVQAVADDLGLREPAMVSGSGEVAVLRRLDGTFRVPVEVDGHPLSFMFDTGASAAVLTSETARALGFRPETLRFRVPVSTANGSTLAAPVTLQSVTIGPIRLTRVPALVVGPGLLQENLLGQTVLDRLESYEVRGKRLVLRAATR